MKHKKYFLLGGIFLLLAAGAAALWWFGLLGGDKALLRKIKDRSDLVELYNKARKGEAGINKAKNKEASYLSLALDWKSIGELSGDEVFFQKALEVYEQGIEKFGEKNILFYLNGGKVAERLADFDKAERYYKKAITISSADESGYLNLVDLYRYKLNKPPREIIKIFEEGEKNMANAAALTAARASYLLWAQDYAEALKYYKILSEMFPANAGYKQIIGELEGELKE